MPLRLWLGCYLRRQDTPFLASQSEIKLAVDISNWSGFLWEYPVEQWVKEGVCKAIVGTQKSHVARQQLEKLVAAGIEVEAYVWLDFDGFGEPTPADYIAYAMAVIEGFPVKRLWLDCEAGTDGASAQNVALIQQAVDACGDFPCGIYTRRGWWIDATNNSEDFKHLPLWEADYTGVPKLEIEKPFGGWTARAMHQYAENQKLQGITVDLNVYPA